MHVISSILTIQNSLESEMFQNTTKFTCSKIVRFAYKLFLLILIKLCNLLSTKGCKSSNTI